MAEFLFCRACTKEDIREALPDVISMVPCLGVCTLPTPVAVQERGKATTIHSVIEGNPAILVKELGEYGDLISNSIDGAIAYSDRPKSFQRIIARVPAVPSDENTPQGRIIRL